MNRILIGILLSCLSLFCLSCFEEKDLGFPKKVTFPKEGGEMTISGNISFTHAVIQDYKGNHGSIQSDADGRIFNEYDWLKVEYVKLSNDVLKIYAEPNAKGKSRKLYVEIHSGREYHVTKVTQF